MIAAVVPTGRLPSGSFGALGTPAIARKSYVHPAILELVNAQDVKAALAGLPVWRISGLTAGEQRLMVLIG